MKTAYQYKTVRVNGKNKYVHRYIMEHYLGRELTTDEIVPHINGDRDDNRIENLEILTQSEHIKRHFEDGSLCNQGENQGASVLKEEDVLIIIYCLNKGIMGKKLAEIFGVSPQLICDIKKNRRWKHIKR